MSADRPSRWSGWAEWLAAGAAIGIYQSVWGSLSGFAAAIDHCPILFCDFVRHFYPMGQTVLVTSRPVPGFFYPPFAALAFEPLGRLQLPAAEIVWGGVQVLSIGALIIVPNHAFFRDRPWIRVANAFLVATSVPILHGFKWGQVSVVLTALTLVALWLRSSGKLALPAILLAAAISIKIYPAVVLVYLFLKRDMRFVALCAALILGFSVVLPLAVLGPWDTWQFFLAVQRDTDAALQGWVSRDPNSQYVAHVFGRLGMHLGSGAWGAIGVAVIVANLGLLFGVTRAGVQRTAAWSWVLSFGSLPFLLQTMWPHYLVYLPLSQGFVALEIAERRDRVAVAAVASSFLFASFLGSSALCLIVAREWVVYSNLGLLFFANLAVLAAAWIILAAEFWRRGP